MAAIAPSDIPAVRRKAYSYLRFSTPEQSKGNSFDRQLSMAVAYANSEGLDLDRNLTFHDVGVSAYRGQNAEAGRLSFFLEAVRSGQVPQGAVLLVEQLDRLSRLVPRKALRVLEDILDAGVSVVTLNDGREYTSQSIDANHTDLIISVLTFVRANEESATKARRLKASWAAKRDKLGERPLTGRLPAWLRLAPDGGSIKVVAERGEVVRRMFSMALEGIGQHSIAAMFNREGLKPWGRGAMWHRSYIAKVLANPAVVGTLQPHVIEYEGSKKRRKALEPVQDYFPPVVALEAFQEVKALRQALGAPQRGRHAHAPLSNVLAGLASCPVCGATMTRVHKGKRSRPSLVCTRAKSGAGCAYRSVPYQAVQDALLAKLPERLEAREGVGAGEDLYLAIQGAEELADKLRARAARYLDNLGVEHSPAIVRRLRETEGDLEEAERAFRELQERQEAATGLTIGARVSRALEALQPPEDPPDIAQVNRALRSLFTRAVIEWRAGMIELEWTHGGSLVLPYTTTFDDLTKASREDLEQTGAMQ